jgi:hypothetical protein
MMPVFALFARRAALACAASSMAVACGAAPASPAKQARARRVIECSQPAPNDFFLVGDDPATRAPLESGTELRFVRYDGETLVMLPECSARAAPPSLGAYACQTFMEPYDGTYDVDHAHVLCEKYPLATQTLGARFGDGAAMRVRVGVAGLCTATRASIHRAQIARIAGCNGATHFVYSYDVGGLEISLDGAIVAGETRGDLSKCSEVSMRALRSCKVPVHVELRSIDEGGTPPVPIETDPPSALSTPAP